MTRNARFVSTLFATLVCAQLSWALPPGYKEDFNGCAATEDRKEREACCQSVYDDCEVANCEPGDDPITCKNTCFWAQMSCQDGDILETRVSWPAGPNGWLTPKTTENWTAGSQTLHVAPSEASVVVDVVHEGVGAEPKDAVSLVARCQCPEGLPSGLECRAVVDAQGAECRICRAGADDALCKPCNDCTTSLTPITSCDDRP